jgi:zinc transport system ATP-binding protein
MRQKIKLAQALVHDPELLLLDEPTNGIDVGSEEPIFLMLNDIKKKRRMTILLITHDIHTVKEYTEYLLALNRCVTFFGKSEEIANFATQRAIYGGRHRKEMA